MTSIKICGITREEDLALCEELSIDFVGFNFVPTSPRCIPIDRAKSLASGLRRSKAGGIVIGNQGIHLGEIIGSGCVDAIQIYDPTLEELLLIQESGLGLIHGFRSVPETDFLASILAAGHDVLIDGAKNGSMANLSDISRLPNDIRKHIFLAGGLTPKNVAAAIGQVHPFAVDVASGIESSPGIKDHGMMKAFVEIVRGTAPR